MSKVREIPLGLVTVRTGGDDPEWVKALLGDYPSTIDLSVNCFPRIRELPRGVVEEILFVVNYGEYFQNNDAVWQRHQSEGFVPKSIAHLIAIRNRVPELWEQGVAYVEAGDPSSFWLNSNGNLCVPMFFLNPDYRELDAYWVGVSRGGDGWFLVGKETGLLGS